MPFTVATYNILASSYIKPEWYAGVSAYLLRPEARVPAVARHVAALDADILCLQEVEPDVFAALASHLDPLGYAGYYERKGAGPAGRLRHVRAHRGVRRANRQPVGVPRPGGRCERPLGSRRPAAGPGA